MDRFSQGLPDPQEARVFCNCAGCGGEIYIGQDATSSAVGKVYCNEGCLLDDVGAVAITAGEG